jgi:hypothetical protein
MADEQTDDDGFPEGSPFEGKDHLFDTHAGKMRALGEALIEADPDEIERARLILADGDTEWIVKSEAVDASEEALERELAVHILMAARRMSLGPEQAANRALEALRERAE